MSGIEKGREELSEGKGILGIEFSSALVNAVLIGTDYSLFASASYRERNSYVNEI